jgi:hypothetical protein
MYCIFHLKIMLTKRGLDPEPELNEKPAPHHCLHEMSRATIAGERMGVICRLQDWDLKKKSA